MATASGIRAGKAYIELSLDNNKFTSGLQRAERQLVSMGKTIGTAGAALTGFAALGAGLFLPMIKAASDFTETQNKFKAVFGEQADAAEEFAKTLSDTVGRSLGDVMDGMAAFNSQLIGVGFNPEAARTLSEELQSLALDFASFNNLQDDDALQRFISAMSGSSEVVDRFGINLKQAALDQELLRLGFQKTSQGATESQKALARFNIIRDTLGRQGAIGDAVKTSNEFAGQLKRLQAAAKDVTIAIGNQLKPAALGFLQAANAVAKPLLAWVNANKSLIQTAAKVIGVIGAIGAGMVALGLTITLLGTALGGLTIPFTIVSSIIGATVGIVTALISPLGLVAAAAVATGLAIIQAFGGVGAVVDWLGDRFAGLFVETSGAFKAIKDALATGDINAAAEVLWAGLQVTWARGVLALNQTWDDWKTYFLDIFDSATITVAQIFTSTIAAIQTGWIQAWGFVQDAFFIVIGAVQTGFLNMGASILGVLDSIGEAVDDILGTQLGDNLDAAEERLRGLSQSIGENTTEGVGRRDVERRNRLEQVEAARKGTIEQLEEERNRRKEVLANRDLSSIEEAQKKLEDAREAYRKAVEPKTDGADTGAVEGPAGIGDIVAQLAGGLGAAAESLGSSGVQAAVFGGARAGQIFGSVENQQLAVMEEQLAVQEQTKEEITKQRKQTQIELAFTG